MTLLTNEDAFLNPPQEDMIDKIEEEDEEYWNSRSKTIKGQLRKSIASSGTRTFSLYVPNALHEIQEVNSSLGRSNRLQNRKTVTLGSSMSNGMPALTGTKRPGYDGKSSGGFSFGNNSKLSNT